METYEYTEKPEHQLLLKLNEEKRNAHTIFRGNDPETINTRMAIYMGFLTETENNSVLINEDRNPVAMLQRLKKLKRVLEVSVIDRIDKKMQNYKGDNIHILQEKASRSKRIVASLHYEIELLQEMLTFTSNKEELTDNGANNES